MDILKSGAVTLGITLTTEQLNAFETYYLELMDWNQKINLTAITVVEEVQTKHFLDSLTAAAVIDFIDNPSVLDIGTGAGFPGIPLKIAFPCIKLTLLEATAKKATFLEHIVQKLGLRNVEIVTGRAEVIGNNPLFREKYDAVLARALASLPTLAELALPFCRNGGIFIAYKKGDIAEELEQSGKAIEMMGGRLKEIVPVNPELFDDERYLVVIEKIFPTPPDYPRRPGMPEKRPLLP
jgi:16S rRNA (guanine527-N7)-methyltransferase